MRQHCWFHLWWWNILCDQLASITLSRPPDFCSQSFFCLYDSLVFFACQADNSLTKKLGYNSIFLVKILWPMKVNSLHIGNYGWGAYLQFPLVGHFLTTCNCGSWAKTHSISMILNAVGTVCKTTTCTYPSFFTEVSLSGGRRYPLYSFLIVLGLKIENLMCYCGWGLPWICDFECFMVYFYIKLWDSIQVKVKAFTCQATASFSVWL